MGIMISDGCMVIYNKKMDLFFKLEKPKVYLPIQNKILFI